MQIILLEKVINLSNLGDIVKVRDGYARNFLIPKHMAKRATPAALANSRPARQNWKDLPPKSAMRLKASPTRWPVSVSVARKAGMDGRLFGSVGNADIADVLKDCRLRRGFVGHPRAGWPQDDRRIPLDVVIQTDVTANITVAVVSG